MLRSLARLAFVCLAGMTTTLVSAQSAPISPQNAFQVAQQVSLTAPGVQHIAWSPDGDTLAAATSQGVLLFSARDWAALPRLLGGQASPVIDVAYSPAGDLLATVSGSTIRLWDVGDETEVTTLTGSAPIAFNADGSTLGYTNGTALVLYDVAEEAVMGVGQRHTDRIIDIAFSPAGGMVSTTSLDMTLRYWDDLTAEQLGFQRSRRRPLLANTISSNGAVIASGARGGLLRLLNVAMTTESTLTVRPRADVVSVDFSNASGMVLYAVENQLGLWDTGAERPVTGFVHGETQVVQAAFNPAGTIFASAGLDGLIRLWWPAG
jgi:WD40 repeat protein